MEIKLIKIMLTISKCMFIILFVSLFVLFTIFPWIDGIILLKVLLSLLSLIAFFAICCLWFEYLEEKLRKGE